jgi:hypothetical protein
VTTFHIVSGARNELLLRRRHKAAMDSGVPELRRADLRFGGAGGRIIHEPTGGIYFLHRGEVLDARYLEVDAWFATASGDVAFLCHPSGPKTLAELEQYRAQRERRKADQEAASRQRVKERAATKQ